MEHSYVIAYCNIARQQYKLTLAEDNRTVIDFSFYTEPPRGNSFKPHSLTTDSSLRPCPICGSRRVRECDCARHTLPCEPLVGFRFSCIYCSKLCILGYYAK